MQITDNNSILNSILIEHNVDKLMSMVKYPSILTYHNLGERGTLVDSLVEDKHFESTANLYVTEKIDGSNSFICFSTNEFGFVDDYFIGGRTEPLYFMGDRVIVNHSQGIAENLLHIAENLFTITSGWQPSSLYVVFGETYGGKINGWKQYETDGRYGFRIFDVTLFNKELIEEILSKPIEDISIWREHGGQPFTDVDIIAETAEKMSVKTVPFRKALVGSDLPDTLKETYEWLTEFAESIAKLDDSGNGKAEGVVVRTFDRGMIRKIRFEDYEKSKRIGRF